LVGETPAKADKTQCHFHEEPARSASSGRALSEAECGEAHTEKSGHGRGVPFIREQIVPLRPAAAVRSE